MDVMMIFNVVLIILGVCVMVSAFNMKKSNQIGMILAEEEVYKCKDTAGFIACIYRRQAVMGAALIFYGGIELLDKYILEIGGIQSILDYKNIGVHNTTAMVKAAAALPKEQREIVGNLIKMWIAESKKTVVNAIKGEETGIEMRK